MKKNLIVLLLFILGTIMTGCNAIRNEIEHRQADKAVIEMNEENPAIFEYEGQEYTILEDCTDRDVVGAWVAYIEPYNNIYLNKAHVEELIIYINGEFHRAVPVTEESTDPWYTGDFELTYF